MFIQDENTETQNTVISGPSGQTPPGDGALLGGGWCSPVISSISLSPAAPNQ